MNEGSETQVSHSVITFQSSEDRISFSMSIMLRSTGKKNRGCKASNYIYLSIIKLDLGVTKEYQF